MIRRALLASIATLAIASLTLEAGSAPQRARLGMVITQSDIASQIGFNVIKSGGNAIDAVGGHRLRARGDAPDRRQHRRRRLHRLSAGDRRAHVIRLPRSRSVAFVAGNVADRRQVRRREASQQPPGGRRAGNRCGTASGVEGTGIEAVEGIDAAGHCRSPATASKCRTAWRDRLRACWTGFQKYPASLAQFSKNGKPYEQGEILKQPDLARTLTRIADQGPAGFYEGETAALIEKEMKANGGLITMADLKAYQAKRRGVIKGTYRGYDIIGMPPPELGRHRGGRDAEHSRGLRSQGQRLRLGEEHSPRRRIDAPRVRGSRALPGRSGLRERHSASRC